MCSIAIIVFVLDRITKYLASHLSSRIGWDNLGLELSKNSGAAFGIMKGYPYLLIPVSILFICILVYLILTNKSRHPLLPYCFGLMLGGAAGNLFDRIFAGRVIDFISIWIWPNFNIADSALTIGAICAIIILWKNP